MPGAEWLKLLIRHIPDKGEHLVRYYGWYSVRCRGERRRMLEASEAEGEQQSNFAVDEQLDPVFINAVRSTWARLIKKVYEVDPLIFPHCGGEMRFLAVIEEAPVIRVTRSNWDAPVVRPQRQRSDRLNERPYRHRLRHRHILEVKPCI